MTFLNCKFVKPICTIVKHKFMETKDRFLQIISEKGISQQEMAERIGVDASTVSYFCKGKRKPGFEILERIAKAFPDVDLNWLITGISSESHIPNNYRDSSQILDSHDSSDSGQLELNFAQSAPQQLNNITSMSQNQNSCTVNGEKPAQSVDKRIKRVIVLFDDGSIESYNGF